MNILVVDDQKTVVSGIVEGLHWKKLGIDNVYTANSSCEAKCILGCHTIDLLLCDIEMPGENGLALFRYIRECEMVTECIFLTSHADFSYAKEAIALGSFDYILQPAPYEDIETAIAKAAKRIRSTDEIRLLKQKKKLIEDEENLMLDYIITKVYHENIFEQNEFQKIVNLQEENTKQSICVFLPVLIQIVRWKNGLSQWEEELLNVSLKNIIYEIFGRQEGFFVRVGKVDRNHYMLIFGGADKNCIEEKTDGLNQYRAFEDEYLEFSSALFIGSCGNMLELGETIKRLKLMEQNNVLKKNGIFKQSEESVLENKLTLRLNMNRWKELIEKGQGSTIKNEIIDFVQNEDKREKLNYETLKTIHFGFMNAAISVLNQRHMDLGAVFSDMETLNHHLLNFGNFDEMMVNIDILLKYFNSEDNDDKIAKSQIDKAIQYIRDNPDKEISRSELADYVYLNADYFSRLFKKETGYMVKDFILLEKMQLAKQLLSSTPLSISVIAAKVGYVNFSHFSKVFKKVTGMTPGEFRQKS